MAAAAGCADVVEGLLAAGCDPNRPLRADSLAAAPAPGVAQLQGQGQGQDAQAEQQHDAEAAGDGQQRLQDPTQQGRLAAGAGASLPPQEWQVEAPAGIPAAGEAAAQLLAPASLSGCTPLHLAAHFGQLAAAEALLAVASCDVRLRSGQGHTALHLAAAGGHAAVVARLCRVPGEPRHPCPPACPACLPAITAPACPIARTSLGDLRSPAPANPPAHRLAPFPAGVEVSAADACGYTPLHAAAARGHVAVVDLLWARGADVEAAAADGRWAAPHALLPPGSWH